MPLTLAEFVNRWKINALSERSGSQSHFIDLCAILGEEHPAASDAIGERYTFEKPVSKVYGGKGFADVWLRDHFAWEYKGKHKDLRAAYKQINDYREELGNPPLLVVCDMNRFEVHTNFTNTNPRVYSFSLDDVLRNVVTATCPLPPLQVLRALFGDYNVLRPDRTDAFVTQEAAKKFAKLAERLEIENRSETDTPTATKEQIAHFLIRLLFCLFADSIGLLPDRVFRRLVEIDRFYPRRFLKKLPFLFAAMSEEDGIFGQHTIRYFNGGLFKPDDISIVQLDKADMAILYDVAHSYDWSHVAPAIFGTLFERSLNKDRRSLIGAHYTSEEDILLLIEPVVIRPLEQRWAAARDTILSLLQPTPPPALPAQNLSSFTEGEGPASPPATDPPGAPFLPTASPSVRMGSPRPSTPKANLAPSTTTLLPAKSQAEEPLTAFFDHLAQIRILDPACGSGNFLYVALRRLLDLWKEARDFAIANNIHIATGYIADRMPSPLQLFGIETEFYAHELASIVVWIGFLQWKHDNGILEDREPILQKLSNIEHDDAILRYDKQGTAYEPEWPKAEFIVGNPPFLGDKKMRRELDIDPHPNYTTDLRLVYKDRIPGGADLVTFWFEKARHQIEASRSSRAGLLATNSIRMVGNRSVLERILKSGNIFMAWSDRPWSLEGAAVRVSLIGFDNGTETERVLNGLPTQTIHADLGGSANIASALTLNENADLCFNGSLKSGPFDLEQNDAKRMLAAPLNPNNRPNSDVIKPRLIGRDIVRRNQNGWLIDFGSMTQEEAALYELPFEQVRKYVKPLRDLSRDSGLRSRWWLLKRTVPGLRKALTGLARCVVTPEVSKHRVFVWISTNVVPDHKLHVVAREDDYFFGVLHSRIHELWTLATCSWMGVGNDPSYNSDTTFDTFPFPWPPGTEPTEAEDHRVHAIAEAARTLVRLRDAWLNPPGASEADLKDRTLTKLYNLRAAGKCTWLEDAHRTLDEAVFAAYGWPSTLTTQQILANLLALNHQRAAAQPASPPKRPRKANTKAQPPTAANED